MEALKKFCIRVIEFIVIITLAIAGTLIPIIGMFALQVLLLGQKNYLLFISTSKSKVLIVLVEILFMYLAFKFREKMLKKTTLKKVMNLNKGLIIAYLIAIMLAIYCSFTNYTILYEDKIKISSPLTPFGAEYNYSDIKSVDVGVKKENKKTYIPYYKIQFNNNKTTDLLGGSGMDEQDGKRFEDIIVEFDEKLKSQGVTKNVDKKNFDKYSESLDKNFVDRIEKIFED